MASIFFRVYLGILAALIVIATIALFGYRSWHNSQLDQYLIEHSRGTLSLIGDGVQRHRGESRQQWLELARRVTALDIAVQTTAPPATAKPLPSGLMIETPGVQQRRLYMPLAASGGEWLRVTLAPGAINQQFIRGSQLLLLNELGRFPRDQRRQRLAQLQMSFSTALRWQAPADVALGYVQQRAAARGETVVEFTDLVGGELAMRAISPIGNSGDYLVQGPLPLFDPLPKLLVAGALALALALLAISCFALIKPLERRLKRMALEVAQLDPESDRPPITIDGDDEMTALARHINVMSGRIRALLNSKRELNQAVSHELKTPLAKLKFHRELAQVKLARLALADGQPVADHLQSMAGNIDQLNALVEEILLYSRLESDTPPLTWQDQPLQPLIEESWAELERYHGGMQLTLALAGESCRADRFYLQRALLNLLSNACRYGGERVQVVTEQQGDELGIHVDDDGPGIARAHRDKVLEPFYRAEASRNRDLGGTGLGLAIVVQIVRWHSGRLEISDSPLGGARLTMWLPGGVGHSAVAVTN